MHVRCVRVGREPYCHLGARLDKTHFPKLTLPGAQGEGKCEQGKPTLPGRGDNFSRLVIYRLLRRGAPTVFFRLIYAFIFRFSLPHPVFDLRHISTSLHPAPKSFHLAAQHEACLSSHPGPGLFAASAVIAAVLEHPESVLPRAENQEEGVVTQADVI